ncbi:hypothetical protein LCGC14_1473260 [marine sediment metagenome]|uniref:HTH cro/C1-type domain-containing protein n=1 Tax=marine sediment metagenome TaxID=412755 RepID=A0A0F9JXP2_9ZZZZ
MVLALLKINGWTQEHLARLLPTTLGTVSAWCRSKAMPSPLACVSLTRLAKTIDFKYALPAAAPIAPERTRT